jgi:uncharacterized protein (DUF1778 family)
MHTERSTTKTKRLEARISVDQKQLFQHAADLLGCTLTEFAIYSLQEKAKQIIQEYEMIQLSCHDQEAFVQAMLKPSKPNQTLTKAFKRHVKDIESS